MITIQICKKQLGSFPYRHQGFPCKLFLVLTLTRFWELMAGGMNTIGVGGLHYRYIDPEGQSTGSCNFGAFVNSPKTRYTEYTPHIFHTTRSTSTNIIIIRSLLIGGIL